jgi:hypothetical protein
MVKGTVFRREIPSGRRLITLVSNVTDKPVPARKMGLFSVRAVVRILR